MEKASDKKKNATANLLTSRPFLSAKTSLAPRRTLVGIDSFLPLYRTTGSFLRTGRAYRSRVGRPLEFLTRPVRPHYLNGNLRNYESSESTLRYQMFNFDTGLAILPT